ncbi:MAG: nitrilase-related carbon-nitrogen hydrolase [Phycisphaerae bacterium]|nr:nitrilase-related carbon-nitrogen hydrolase [Phycisphaerae bacterium]
MLLAAVQSDTTWHDPATSRAGIERLLDDAALPAGSLALLPELCDVGFTIDLDRVLPSTAPGWAAAQAKRRDMHLAVGYPRRADAPGEDGMGRNECAIARPDGSLAPAYAKVHPFGVGRETEAYSGGERIVLVTVGPFTACPLICYDLRFPELWRLATLAGADLFLIGASWPAERQHHWRSLLIARAIENQAFVVACNRVGSDPTLHYAGGSLIIGPSGDVLAEGGDSATVIAAECDAQSLAVWRRKFPALRDVRASLLGTIEIVRA